MKYLRKFNISEAISPSEKEEIEMISDIFQDIIDEGYDFKIRPNQRHIENDIVFGVQYNIDIAGISNDFSDEEYYHKNYDISKIVINNIERLEKMGYEIIYRNITSTMTNAITSSSCKIQFWSRIKRHQPRMSDTDVIAEGKNHK